MIKVVTGWNRVGGSTVALCNLVNLFNENGKKACLYTDGLDKWNGINCEWKDFGKLNLDKYDNLIYHFWLPGKTRLCRRQILSCHETRVFTIKSQFDNIFYDNIHFVSQSQQEWQGLSGNIIPNVIRKVTKREKNFKVAGIIGSIDENKRVDLSIQNALKDGFDDIRIYGNISDYSLFTDKILPLLSDKVKYCGVSTNMDETYKHLSHVYHSPLQESYNMIKPECEAAGVVYVGNEGNDTKAEVWDNKKIFDSWMKLIN